MPIDPKTDTGEGVCVVLYEGCKCAYCQSRRCNTTHENEARIIAARDAESAELRKEIERLNALIHPWYGPCDGIANGQCSECLRLCASGPARRVLGWLFCGS